MEKIIITVADIECMLRECLDKEFAHAKMIAPYDQNTAIYFMERAIGSCTMVDRIGVSSLNRELLEFVNEIWNNEYRQKFAEVIWG